MVAKLFCDAAYCADKREARIGIAVRKNRKRIYSNTLTINGVNDSVEAEFHAIYKGIITLKELGITTANINSDGKTNILMIKGKCKIKRKYRILVSVIHEVNKEMSLTYKWIPRNQNQIAHMLTI